MAIDTNQDRLSMLNFGDGGTFHVLPEPTASIDTRGLLHLLDLFSGLGAGVSPTSLGLMYTIDVDNVAHYRPIDNYMSHLRPSAGSLHYRPDVEHVAYYRPDEKE